MFRFIPRPLSLIENLDITNYIYENPGALDLNTKGFWISDRRCKAAQSDMASSDLTSRAASIGWDVIQEEMPAVNFVKKYQDVFSLKYALPLDSNQFS